MASSFEKAFTQAYQAEMARRKDAEAEIARELRAEKRFEREMDARREMQLESEDRAHLQKIEDEQRRDDREERERQRVENEARWLAASRTDPSIAADFSGDWRDDQRKIAAMEALDVRAEKAGVGKFGGDMYYQPAGREGGRPVTEATPEYIASLDFAEERQKAQRAAAHVREAEESRLGAGRAVRENAAFDRAVAEFGISVASKKEGTWDNFYEKRDAAQKLSQSEEASNYSAQYSKMSDLYMALPPYQRVGIDTKDGILTRKGVSQLLQFGGYEQVERKDPETGETKWIKVARFARPDIKPLESGASGQVGEQVGVVQGPIQERTGWGRTGNVGVESNFLKSTEQYVPTSPEIPSAQTQETPMEEGDQDFFSYLGTSLDKIRKNRFVKPVEAISGPIPYATKLATDALTESELWKKYGPSDKLKYDLTPPWLRPKQPAPPSTKPWSQDYFTR